MRGSSVIAAGFLLGGLLSCVPSGQFRCVDAASCSRRAEGMCEPDGWCSYPDLTCESERRYSELAGERASECVEVEEPHGTGFDPFAATGSESSGSSGSESSSEDGDGSSTAPR